MIYLWNANLDAKDKNVAKAKVRIQHLWYVLALLSAFPKPPDL